MRAVRMTAFLAARVAPVATPVAPPRARHAQCRQRERDPRAAEAACRRPQQRRELHQSPPRTNGRSRAARARGLGSAESGGEPVTDFVYDDRPLGSPSGSCSPAASRTSRRCMAASATAGPARTPADIFRPPSVLAQPSYWRVDWNTPDPNVLIAEDLQHQSASPRPAIVARKRRPERDRHPVRARRLSPARAAAVVSGTPSRAPNCTPKSTRGALFIVRIPPACSPQRQLAVHLARLANPAGTETQTVPPETAACPAPAYNVTIPTSRRAARVPDRSPVPGRRC